MAGQNLLGTLRVRLSAETEDFRRGMNNARKQLDGFEKRIPKFRAGVALSVTAIAALGTAFAAMAIKAAEAGAAIEDMANRTGLSVRRLQEFQYIGDQLGFSVETVEKAVEGLTRRIPQIERGTGDVAAAWDRLGISLRGADGEFRSMSDLLPDTLRALSGIENQTERNAVAAQLFGRSASELAPLLAASGDEIDRLTARANDMGLVLSDQVVSSLADMDDALAEMRLKMGRVTQEIAAAFAPTITNVLIPALNWLLDIIRDIVRGWQAVGASAALVIGAKEALAEALKMNFTSAREILEHYYQAWQDTVDEIFNLTNDPTKRPDLPVPDPAETRTLGREAAFEYFDGLREEWERMRHEIALRQLDVFGGKDADEQRLQMEERHALNLLQIESDRIDALAEAGVLEGAALDRAREELEIRRAIVRQRKDELSAIAKADKTLGLYADLGSSIADAAGVAMPSNPGSAIGRNAGRIAADQFGNIAGMLGGTMGSFIMPGVGSVVGGMLGSAVGGMFGNDEPREVKQLRTLEAIQQNTRESIAAIEKQTDDLLNPTQRFLNLPTSFSVPAYNPAGMGSGDTINHVTVTINGATMSAEEIAQALNAQLNKEIRNGMRLPAPRRSGPGGSGIGGKVTTGHSRLY